MDPQTLLLFFSYRQPRRIKVIENLLRGRETVSTLYWGMRYHLLGYLGILSSIDINVTRRSLLRLVAQNKLIKLNNNSYLINQRRVNLIRTNYLKRYLNVNLHYDLKRFKDRFLLATQVVSEYSYHNSSYYPLQISWQDSRIVKYWFHCNKEANLVLRFYQILKMYFTKLANIDRTLAWQAASLLIGYQHPGLTLMQLKQKLGYPIVTLKLRQLGILCGLIVFILRFHDQLLTPLLINLKIFPTSNSARLTFKMYLRCHSLALIAKQRHLKMSTIKEHLLTVAIFSNQWFPYHWLLPRKLLNELSFIYRGNVDYWSYKHFQQLTGKSIDFFYFRLYQIMRSKVND